MNDHLSQSDHLSCRLALLRNPTLFAYSNNSQKEGRQDFFEGKSTREGDSDGKLRTLKQRKWIKDDETLFLQLKIVTSISLRRDNKR